MAFNNEFVAYARDGKMDEIERMIAQGVDPDTTNVAGATALELAALGGHKKIVRYLLSVGASPNPSDLEKPHSTALIRAATNGDTEIVRELLSYGANPNVVDDGYQQTALMWASAYGESIEVVRTLLEYGADSTIKDINGNTALALAEGSGFKEIATLLRNHEIKANKK